jgi:hypothetical protein
LIGHSYCRLMLCDIRPSLSIGCERKYPCYGGIIGYLL